MHPLGVLRRVLPGLPCRPLRGPWYRAVSFDAFRHGPPSATFALAQPLWPGGAARRCARFTPRAGRASGSPGIDCLYLAEDELTPLAEISGVPRPPGSRIQLLFEPQVLMTVAGSVSNILDLTDPVIQRSIGTTHMALTGVWVLQQSLYLAGLGPMPSTQVLGREAFNSGRIHGLRYPSSKNAAGVGIVVFTARLRRGTDKLEVFNRPGGALQQSLP